MAPIPSLRSPLLLRLRPSLPPAPNLRLRPLPPSSPLCHHISLLAAPSLKTPRLNLFPPFPFPVLRMLPSPVFRRDISHHSATVTYPASDMSPGDHSPMFSFDESMHFDPAISDSDQMIFGPLEFDDPLQFEPKSPFLWEPFNEYNISNMSTIPFPASPESTSSQIDSTSAMGTRRFDSTFSNCSAYNPPSTPDYGDAFYSNWLNDPDLPSLSSTSVPIPIPPTHAQSPLSSFVPYSANSVFPDVTLFSPNTALAALQPLPLSPPDDTIMTEQLLADAHAHAHGSMSPPAYKLEPPAWASQLWDASPNMASAGLPVPIAPLSEDPFATQRQRVPVRRGLTPVTQLFQSSSAPSASHARTPPLVRSYTRRAESISEHDDRDATIRKKRRPLEHEDPRPAEKRSESPPLKSTLRPPKLAPSAWQLYFTDWIQRHQASSSKKLNVAQAAKEAGQEYALLSPEEKEPYKRRSQELKDAREREHAAYMRTLTPDDIKRENAFRTAQRKAGKSRRGNIKDPNAPKKPLSAYFMFLQQIRSDPELVREVFGDETETTKQSVLAAAKWRAMTDDERKPFLAQAEHDKLDYESKRKMYEDGTVGYGTSINFSILPGNPLSMMSIPRSSSRPLKQESESESDGFSTDDGADRSRRS
ncbi:hypothetical protein A0H81_03853 [Grifola frondosa]|uniref:HMG box domain-containing protein n=1 Tax=Grifola frondosa TaxID=5627 RepID=A0A1C7MJM7_GRIFR|nr:hypothetical protein A0H81_03853 [Grifola frondosa]